MKLVAVSALLLALAAPAFAQGGCMSQPQQSQLPPKTAGS